jgi:hypothetical protein
MKRPHLLLCLATALLLIVGCQEDDIPLPGSGTIRVEVNGTSYREPIDAIYDYREEDDEDVVQAHLLREGTIGFSVVMRSAGERTIGTGFFSPDTADGLKPCRGILVLDERLSYDAVSGRTQIIELNWERKSISLVFDFKMVNSLNRQDTLKVSGGVSRALLLTQE